MNESLKDRQIIANTPGELAGSAIQVMLATRFRAPVGQKQVLSQFFFEAI